MKLSDLFESSTVILEARHHDLWKEFKDSLKRNAKLDMETSGARQLNALTDTWLEDNLIERVFNLDLNNSIKQWFVTQTINQISGSNIIKMKHFSECNLHLPKLESFFNRKFKDNELSYSLELLANDLEHYSGINYRKIKDYNPLKNNDTTKSFLNNMESLEEEYKEIGGEGSLEPTGEETALVKVREYTWYNLGKSYCKDEGDAMHHCGNVDGKINSNDRILSLRSTVQIDGKLLHKPHLTFILDSNGFLGEMKGRANNKPNSKYHEAIIALLKLDIIKGIKAGGYKPENNFSLDDLSQSQRKDLEKSKGKDWFDMNMVLGNPESIKDIENPSEKVQLAAVSQNVSAIRFIKNPSEKLQLAAVTKRGYTIEYIKDPSKEVQLIAVRQNGYAIQHIDNPSEEVQLAAVKQEGDAIRHIKNPSEAVQLAAVKQNGHAIEYIIDGGITPSEQVQLAAVQNRGAAIHHIDNPSEEVQLAAVQNYDYAIGYIDNPSEKVKALHNKLWGQ